MSQFQLITQLDFKRAFKAIKKYGKFKRQLKNFKAAYGKEKISWPISKIYPCLMDADEKSGNYDGHYFHQDIIVAKRILEANPKIHMDVGSRVDGFIAHLACFRSVTVIDIRPSQKSFHGISYLQADMMKPLNDSFQGICDSLSCLHALEHFGLGRYGDPIRPDGHLSGFDNLSKMLTIGGKLYLSFPIGPQRIEFNAHRVFSIKTAIEMLSKKFVIDRFTYIDDGGTPHENQSLTAESISNNFNCHYGCGIFEATKISD